MSGSWQRSVSVLFCFCILANCGSSSGGTPDNTDPKYPVVFEPVFAPAGRFEGSFNLLAAVGTYQDGGSAPSSTKVQSYGLTLGDFEENDIPTTVTLTLPDGQTVGLTSTATGFYSGTNGGEVFTLIFSGGTGNMLRASFFRGSESGNDSAFGTIGYETPETGMPLSGFASYTGQSNMVASGIVSPEFNGNGAMALGVDFASGTVSGDVFRGDDAVISLTDGQVVDNGFVGQLSVTSSPFMNSIDGTTQGIFYGEYQPAELAGVFEGSFSGPDGAGTVAGFFSGANAPLR